MTTTLENRRHFLAKSGLEYQLAVAADELDLDLDLDLVLTRQYRLTMSQIHKDKLRAR